MSDATSRMFDALLITKRRHPLFYDAFARTSFIARPGLGTMAVDDRYRVYFDPEVVLAWDIGEVATVIAHEVCHPLLEHSKRFASFMGLTQAQVQLGVKDPTGVSKDVAERIARMRKYGKQWNIAADCEINHILDGHPFPEGFHWTAEKLQPPMARGLSAEEYLQAMMDNAPEETGEEDTNQDSDDGRPPEQGGSCGSGATGIPVACEAPQDGEASGVDARTAANIRRKVADAVRKDAKGPLAGRLPGHSNRYIKTDKYGQTRWEIVLAGALHTSVETVRGSDDYTYGRISRYQEAVGWSAGAPVLEAMETPLVRVHVAVDTSASMRPSHIERAIAEIRRLLQDVECQLTVSSIDCKAHKFVEVTDINDLVDAITGDGGTSFVPLFSALSAPGREPPGILVVITDGGGPAPAAPPPYPVVWLLVDEKNTRPWVSDHYGTPVTYGTEIKVRSVT